MFYLFVLEKYFAESKEIVSLTFGINAAYINYGMVLYGPKCIPLKPTAANVEGFNAGERGCIQKVWSFLISNIAL